MQKKAQLKQLIQDGEKTKWIKSVNKWQIDERGENGMNSGANKTYNFFV